MLGDPGALMDMLIIARRRQTSRVTLPYLWRLIRKCPDLDQLRAIPRSTRQRSRAATLHLVTLLVHDVHPNDCD